MEYRIKDRYIGNKRTNRYIKFYKYKCNVCGWDNGLIEEPVIKKGCGCSCCAGKTVVEGINDISTTAPWMVKYFQGGHDEAKLYTKSSDTLIYPICPDCGEISDKKIKISKINNNHSIICNCGDGISYPNKFIFNLILQIKNQLQYYEREYSPNWIGRKKYDMYIELIGDRKFIIEMDGGLGHGHDNNFIKGKDSILVDKYKDEIAKNHNIKVIRIDCTKSEFINIKNNIINSELISIINFDNVDWLLCHEESLKNIVKEVCTYKQNHPDITRTELSSLFNLAKDTISKYLNNGNLLGWCNYDSKQDLIKQQKLKGKKVINLSDNILFNSISEASKYYTVSRDTIKNLCNKNNDWKYFDETIDNTDSFFIGKI